MGRRSRRTLIRDLVALLSLLIFVSVWHFGVIFGTHQPVGGDKTAFFYGLMSYYGECLNSGTLPFWNERWGFGFPQLAESQSGALYFPHLIFYKLLPVFDAFRVNFAFHRILIVIVAYYSFRGMRLRTSGAWFACLVYVSGGFAIGHFDHQWAMESMVWLPAILWASHQIAMPLTIDPNARLGSNRARWIAFVSLPVFIAVQLSIGHFQIAFMSAVTSGLMVAFLALFQSGRQRARLHSTTRHVIRACSIWLLGTSIGYGMAAAQLAPTFFFAQEVRERNRSSSGFNYLSTHALPPWVNLNLVCPSLYFKEPLWRGVVWTPAHSAPEECLNYAGLLPLCVAVGGMLTWRRAPFVRTWSLLLLVAVLLSWGPFLQPTFRTLASIPGFSFFRSAARWILIQNIAIALLAGWTFDHVRSPARYLRWWRRSIIAGLLIALHVAGFWFALSTYARSQELLPKSISTSIAALFPFGEAEVSNQIVRSLADAKTWEGDTWKLWAKTKRGSVSARLIDQWSYVLSEELLPTVVVVCFTSLLLWIATRWRKRFRLILCLIAILDLGYFAYLFPDPSVPCEKLRTDGPVATKLKTLGDNSRTIASLSNFAMSYRIASLQSYRTLDIPLNPMVAQLIFNAHSFPAQSRVFSDPPHSRLAVRAIVTHPLLSPQAIPETQLNASSWTSDDPQLDLWLDGNLEFRKLLAQRGLNSGTKIEIVNDNPIPALLIDKGKVEESQRSAIMHSPAAYNGIGTIKYLRTGHNSRTFEIVVQKPSYLVISELFTKGWEHGELVGADGARSAIAIEPFDGYFQFVPKPFSPGKYVVTTHYESPGWRLGCSISIGSFAAWIVYVASSLLLMRSATNHR